MNSPSAPFASTSGRKPFHDTSQDFHQFLAAYRAQEWAQARRIVASCRELDEGLADLYDMYETRINGLERNPPGPEWNGVFVAQTK